MTKLSELKTRWMSDPEFRKEYEEAGAELAIVETLIRARNRARLSQAELARRIGTTQSAIARLESGSISPSLSTLRRYAAATGTQLHMELVPKMSG